MTIEEKLDLIPEMYELLKAQQEEISELKQRLADSRNMKVWLTEAEACEYIHLSRSTLWQLRQEGKIVGNTGPGKNLYYRPSLDEYAGRKAG
jgi:hypothetical protein